MKTIKAPPRVTVEAEAHARATEVVLAILADLVRLRRERDERDRLKQEKLCAN